MLSLFIIVEASVWAVAMWAVPMAARSWLAGPLVLVYRLVPEWPAGEWEGGVAYLLASRWAGGWRWVVSRPCLLPLPLVWERRSRFR